MTTAEALTASPRVGRAPATTHGELSHVAIDLFLARGFEGTTIDDIATAAGISRRTFFRYFPSKNDLPWGDFDALLSAMRTHLAAVDPAVPIMTALRQVICDFNRYPTTELPHHRDRMHLLLEVPALMAHATLRYADWRQVVAEFVAARRGEAAEALTPQTIAWACLSISLSAYEQWLSAGPDELPNLPALIDDAFAAAESVLGAGSGPGSGA